MNEFERVSDEVNGELSYTNTMDHAIEWTRNGKDAMATVTLPAGRFRNKIEKLAEEHPEDVTIRYRNNDGSIVATIPVRYIKISAPKQMTDEQREVLAERMRALHDSKSV